MNAIVIVLLFMLHFLPNAEGLTSSTSPQIRTGKDSYSPLIFANMPYFCLNISVVINSIMCYLILN